MRRTKHLLRNHATLLVRLWTNRALAEIDAALQRLRDGPYGVCEKTGELIPRERLNAIPWARYTVKAQAEVETGGDTPHAHLRPVGSVRSH